MSRFRVRIFSVVSCVLLVLIAFQAIVYAPRKPETARPEGPALAPSVDPFLPSSQTLVNATQTGGNCGSGWTNLKDSDDARCSYQEVDRSPADQIGLVTLPDGTDVNGWVGGTGSPCSTDATPWDELDDGADTNDGDTTCRQGSVNGNRVGTTMSNPSLTDPSDVDDFTVVSSSVVKKVASQGASIAVDVKVGGSAYSNGATQTTTTSYVRYSRTSNVNPITGLEWTATDINNLVVGTRCVDCSPNNRATQMQAKVDAIYNAEYAFEVRFAWSGVPLTGDRWTLVAECKRLTPGSEDVLIQVGQGGGSPTNWKTVYTCASDTDQSFNSYKLTSTELNGGAPVVRVWDNNADTPDDTVQGTMALDVLRIDRSEYRTGYSPWHYYVDRMVNADNGNLYLSFRDLTVKALGWNLEIVRSYNHKLSDLDGLLGFGWTFTYDTRIVEEADGIAQWWDPDGSVHTFVKSGTNWVAPSGVDAKLTKSTTFTLWFKEGSKFLFNSVGRLSTMLDRNGNTVALTWTQFAPIQLTSVADGSGLRLSFLYRCGFTCRIDSVTDPIGRVVRYAYDGNGNLQTYTDAMGNNTYFTYDGSHRMLTWREPGNPFQIPAPQVQRVTFRYDGSDRVDQIKRASVNAATNATSYEYVAYGLAYASAGTIGNGGSVVDQYTNTTNARNVVTSVEIDVAGAPLKVAGPQCGDCASLTMGPPDGKPACCAGGGCGSGRGSLTEEIVLTWDSDLNLLTRADKGNHEYVYTYDARHNLLNTTDPSGNVTRNVWANVDNSTTYISTLNKTTNARGFTWFYEYDASGNLKQAKDPTNNVTKREYDSKGYVKKVTDWRGFNTTFDYDSHGYLLNRTDATNNKTTYLNDGVGRITRETHPDSHFSRVEYDRNDRVTKTIDELNNATTFTYNARNDLIAQRDPLGRLTAFEWNATSHFVSRVIDASGNSTTFGYDLVGNLVKLMNPRGFNTTLTYDDLNRRTVVRDALNNETHYTYDVDGLATAMRDRRGFYTNYTYDALHRPKTVRDALGNSTTYNYDQVGNRISVKNGRAYFTNFTYDALNRMTKVTDPLGNFTRVDYDANGNVVALRDPNTNSQSMAYDAVNRVKTVTSALGFVTTNAYDSEGNLVQVKDAEGRVTAYVYDALNRRTQIKDALNDTTNLTYDAVGNLLNITDDNGRVTRREYNGLNRLTKETSPMGKVTQFTYDANGNVRTRTDALLRTTTYTYDALNRMTKTAYPMTNLTFTYDAEGNRLTATGFGFTRTDVYDALNRAASTTFNYGPFSKQMQYTYDEVGNRKTMRYPEGQTLTSTYDSLNRLTTLQDSVVGSWTIVYDAASRRTRITHPNGLRTEYAYNKANWILGVYTNTSGGSVVESFTYTYDKLGNRGTMVEDSGNTSTYGYDPTYRLTSESYTGGLTINYTYDGVGNRLKDVRNGVTTSYMYDADNRLTARGTMTYGYDDNGNMIRRTVGGQNTTFDWDIENRLTKVTFPNATTAQYEYSTDANRISRMVAGVKVWYGYDFRDRNGFDDVIAEYNATGGLVARYVHGPGADEPLAMVRGGTFFVSFDGLGSTTRLTTTAQVTNARYRYEAFGAFRDAHEGAQTSYRFTTRELDQYTTLYYYRARWYDSTSGRFGSKDPAGMVDGPNPYAYVGNNPTNRVDPTGQQYRNCAWWDVGCHFLNLVCGICIWLTSGLIQALILSRAGFSSLARLCVAFSYAICSPLAASGGWAYGLCLWLAAILCIFIVGAWLYVTAYLVCRLAGVCV